MAQHGEAWHGKVKRELAGQAGRGKMWQGMTRLGLAQMVKAWSGASWYCSLGSSRRL